MAPQSWLLYTKYLVKEPKCYRDVHFVGKIKAKFFQKLSFLLAFFTFANKFCIICPKSMELLRLGSVKHETGQRHNKIGYHSNDIQIHCVGHFEVCVTSTWVPLQNSVSILVLFQLLVPAWTLIIAAVFLIGMLQCLFVTVPPTESFSCILFHTFLS